MMDDCHLGDCPLLYRTLHRGGNDHWLVEIDTRLTHAYLCLQHYIHVYWLGHIIER